MRGTAISAALGALLLVAARVHPASTGVTFEKGDNRIDVNIDGKPFTTYYYASDLPRPFFHPVRAADGRVVTRGFPMIADAPGEAKDRDHPHHRALWFTHGDVDGVDYWGEAAKVQGRIVHRSIDTLSAGKRGVLAVTRDWIDNTGRKTLVEKEEVAFQGDATRRIVDFRIDLRPAEGAVVFRDTKEGSFAIRLATPLKEQNGGAITSSRGAVGEKNCWGKPADWVDYSGTLDGAKLGVAIMDHPASFRHPTTWHVRAYGLFAANPFGLRDFTGDKAADGSHRLEPGKHLVLRYRVLVHPGSTAEANIAAEYQRYLQEVK
ncbi:MAG: hypothetical protein DMG07_02115 [Acidobacteria bacterium]|nr:MAG: hypothetical protein DMG07_02115 [Acidobacteriota bacterium]